MPRDPLANHTIKARLLRRALVLLGVSIVIGSATTLTFAAKRIVAENAAYKGPAAPDCIPSQLNRSDILPGTGLQVSPLPDSLDASYGTQISLLGAPISALSSMAVSNGMARNMFGTSRRTMINFLQSGLTPRTTTKPRFSGQSATLA